MDSNDTNTADIDSNLSLPSDRIRAKALELFARKGVAQVGMRELASHIGLSVGGFYYYFKNKEDVLFELIDELYEDLLATLNGERDEEAQTIECALLAHLRLYMCQRPAFTLAERHLGELSPDRQQAIRLQESAYTEGLSRLAAKGMAGRKLLFPTTFWPPLLGFLRALFDRLDDSSFREEMVITLGLSTVDRLFNLVSSTTANIAPPTSDTQQHPAKQP